MTDTVQSTGKRLDVVLLGATGFTGRQALRHLVERYAGSVLRWGIAGRDRARLQRVLDEALQASGCADAPALLIADTGDPASLQALAAATRVLVNLAGPYAACGEAVIAACIAQRAHYLDLTGETFWVRQMIARHHAAARDAGVKIVPCAGYEALPFDIATLMAAREVGNRYGLRCTRVDLKVRFTGRRFSKLSDAVSAGTVASMSSILAADRSDSLRNAACLVEDRHAAAALRLANRYTLLPRRDPDDGLPLAPTVPAPFVVPPVVLRSAWLLGERGNFAMPFRYREGTDLSNLVPKLPSRRRTAAAQWTAATSLSAVMANLAAAVAGPLRFQRAALRAFIDAVAPPPGSGPSERALADSGYTFALRATATDGRIVRGTLLARGHPGYRSTPKLLVEAAILLADPTLPPTPDFGVLTPASALGEAFALRLPMADVTLSFA